MPREKSTPYLRLAAGVYLARRGAAVHVITTDGNDPDLRTEEQNTGNGDTNPILSKSNWICEEEVSIEQAAKVLAGVFPDWKGVLVNVAPEGLEPLLVPQSMAPKVAELVERLVAAEVAASVEARAAA